MGVRQSTVHEVNLYLSLTGSPVTGLVNTNFTMGIKKQGGTAFTNKALVPADVVELGSGFYSFNFSAADTNTIGEVIYTLSGPLFDNFKSDKFLVEVAPLGIEQIPEDTCLIQGNIRDIGGNPAVDHRVYIRPVNFPGQSGNTILSSVPVITNSDGLGNFNVALLRNQVVLIDINSTGVKTQITVPDQASALLVDLLP